MTDIPKCTHWLGHKFEARYSVTPLDLEFGNFRGTSQTLLAMIEAQTQRVYERDVCVRCGATVEITISNEEKKAS